MTLQLLINVCVGIAIIGWVGSRQLTWRPIGPKNLWTAPLVLTGIGVVLIANQVPAAAFTVLAIGVLLLEIVLSLVIGCAMGVIARFRRTDGDGWESRTGWVGLVLWVALIGLRIGMDVWAEGIGAGQLLISTGTILLVVGINRATRSAVLALRMSRSAMVAA